MIKKLLIALTLMVSVWWLRIFYLNIQGELENYLWVVLLTSIPLIGGINGFLISRKWGGWKSVLGKSLLFISLGLIGWTFGDAAWSYYNLVEKVEVPYPSIADIGFFSIVPFWSLGMIFLLIVAGGKYVLKTMRGKVLFLLLPLIGFGISYFLFLKNIAFNAENPIKTFFDIGFPLGDAITISLSLLVLGLTARILGGRMRNPILILIFGFVFQYLADFSFSYTNIIGTYFNASWVDMAYLWAQFLVSYGLASFDIEET